MKEHKISNQLTRDCFYFYIKSVGIRLKTKLCPTQVCISACIKHKSVRSLSVPFFHIKFAIRLSYKHKMVKELTRHQIKQQTDETEVPKSLQALFPLQSSHSMSLWMGFQSTGHSGITPLAQQ